MSRSFGIVEDKLREAEFFLDAFRDANRFTPQARYFFSAFVSATRTVTLALKAAMSDIDGFTDWYAKEESELRLDQRAQFFKEIRNGAIHEGLNPLDQVSVDHLAEDLKLQLSKQGPKHVLVLPDLGPRTKTILADAVQESTEYFRSIVCVVLDCYEHFRSVVDPKWYFTTESFLSKGKSFEDAVVEAGFPRVWASFAPDEVNGWRVLRSQQPCCPINDIFLRYAGRIIPDPDSEAE